MKSENTLVVMLIAALIAVLIAPLVLIWSLNTLFGLTIAYGFFEWLAGLFLLGFVKTSVKVNKPE